MLKAAIITIYYIIQTKRRQKEMKRWIYSVLSSLCIVLLMGACDIRPKCGDIIWDIAFIEPKVFCIDTKGTDLLASLTAENLHKITIQAQGQTFGVYTEAEFEDLKKKQQVLTPKKLRSLGPANFYGAVLRKEQTSVEGKAPRYYIAVGQFSGEHNYNEEEIVISWADGTKNRITFSHVIRERCQNLKITNKVYLDGEQIPESEGYRIVIRKK